MGAARRIWTETKKTVCHIYSAKAKRTKQLSLSKGFDDVIYPVDYRVTGHIVDDEMHDIL